MHLDWVVRQSRQFPKGVDVTDEFCIRFGRRGLLAAALQRSRCWRSPTFYSKLWIGSYAKEMRDL